MREPTATSRSAHPFGTIVSSSNPISSKNIPVFPCVDVGHTARAGRDPAQAIRDCRERLYDVHLKDVANPQQRGPEVELGRGHLDVRAILQALAETQFAYHVGLEHEKDPRDPLPGLAESAGYAKGLVRTL